MIVEYKLVFHRSLGNTVGQFHCLLVVAVEKVDLESFHSYSLVFRHSLVEMLVEHVEHSPQYDFHTLRLGVCNKFGQADFGDRIHDVALLRVIPSLVEHHIFNIVLCCKVNIILICLIVDAGLEINTFEIPVVPPVPSNLSRFYPGCVVGLCRFGKCIHEVIHRHLGVLLRYGNDAPGCLELLAVSACNIILGRGDITLLSPRIFPEGLGVSGKPCLKSLAIFAFLYEHTRISPQVAFEDGEFHSAVIYGGGQEC